MSEAAPTVPAPMPQLPGNGIGDYAHALASGAFGYVCLDSLFATILAPPLQRKKDAWLLQLRDAVNYLLAHKGLTAEELRDNDQFNDVVMNASRIAMTTSNKEKRDALRNAVLNAALPLGPDESRQMMFLNWVDTYTPWHLRILSLFADPQGWADRNNAKLGPDYSSWGLDALIEIAYPSFLGEREMIKQISHDLIADRHIKSEAELQHGRGGYPRVARLTSEFLAFISEPPAE